MDESTYCLCQDCLKIYRYTDARHQEEELCSCGGQLCGCSGCNADAIEILWDNRFLFDAQEQQELITE